MSERNQEKVNQDSVMTLSHNFLDYFESLDKTKWVNGRPVLRTGGAWCHACQTWHINTHEEI